MNVFILYPPKIAIWELLKKICNIVLILLSSCTNSQTMQFPKNMTCAWIKIMNHIEFRIWLYGINHHYLTKTQEDRRDRSHALLPFEKFCLLIFGKSSLGKNQVDLSMNMQQQILQHHFFSLLKCFVSVCSEIDSKTIHSLFHLSL